MPSSKYDIDAMRKKMRERLAGRPQDPNEFRPAKAKKDEAPIIYRFYILPGLNEGDKCFGGKCSRGMDDLFFIKNGHHWIEKRPHACPRVLRDEECDLCQLGFDLLGETDDKAKRQAIVKQYLANSQFAVNIFFPNVKQNPEELRNTVKWFNASKTCFDHWDAAFNADDAGDEEDPRAYGCFFDEEAAFLYQLEVKHGGGYNDYKSSKFLAKNGPHPIVRDKNGNPHAKAIQAILDARHDLWTKIDEPDPDKLTKMAHQMLHGEAPSEDDVPATTHSGADDDDLPPPVDDDDGATDLEAETPVAEPPTESTKKETKPAADTKPAKATPPKKVKAAATAVVDTSESDAEPEPEPAKAAAAAAVVEGGDDDDEELDDLLSRLRPDES